MINNRTVPSPPAPSASKRETSIETVESSCPVCVESEMLEHATGVDFEYGTTADFEWKFSQCVNCSSISLSPRPANSELPRI